MALATLALAAAGAGCAAAPAGGGSDGSGSGDPVLVHASTGTTDPTIYGGARDDDGASIPGVVALRVGEKGSYELCSGALLARNVVLTARHCVTKNLTSSVSCDENGQSANGKHVAGEEDPTNIAVYVGASPSFSQSPAAFAKAIVAPESDYLCDSDIAIVVLERDLVGVEPLPVRLGTIASRPGESIRSVGYGQNDMRLPIGTRFRKDNVPVLAVGKAVSASKTPLGPHEFEVGKSICQGDSGGPAISEDTGAVIGVVSRGGSCSEDYGHIYTTTAGFEALFARAFDYAGTAPIAEPEGTVDGTPVRTTSTSPELDNSPEPSAKGCSVGAPAPATARGSLALALAVALVVRVRRRARS